MEDRTKFKMKFNFCQRNGKQPDDLKEEHGSNNEESENVQPINEVV